MHCDPLGLPVLPPSTDHRVGGAYFQGNVRSDGLKFVERLLLPDGRVAEELGVIPVGLPGFRLGLHIPVQDVRDAQLPVVLVADFLPLDREIQGCLGEIQECFDPFGLGFEVELADPAKGLQVALPTP